MCGKCMHIENSRNKNCCLTNIVLHTDEWHWNCTPLPRSQIKIKSKTTDAIIKSNEREHFIITLCNTVVGKKQFQPIPFACNRRHLFVAICCYNFVYSNDLNISYGVNLVSISTFENLFKFSFRKCFFGGVYYRFTSLVCNVLSRV